MLHRRFRTTYRLAPASTRRGLFPPSILAFQLPRIRSEPEDHRFHHCNTMYENTLSILGSPFSFDSRPPLTVFVRISAADRAETKRTAPREFRGAVCRKSSEMKEIGKRSSRKLKRSSWCRKDPSNNVGFQEEALNAFRLQPLSRRCARVQSSSSNAAPFRD